MVEIDPSAIAKRERPLSPHLQVYKPQLTSILSIMHRATGIFLSIGLLLFSWWVIALFDGEESFASVQGFCASPVGLILLLGWIWSLFFHLCTGIRHLFWDAGCGFSIETTYRSGWAVVIVSLLLAAGTSAFAFESALNQTPEDPCVSGKAPNSQCGGRF